MASAKAKSPTWSLVLQFAEMMEQKLDANRHKGNREGWAKIPPRELLRLLRREVRELDEAINLGGDVAAEAADVANFAMMIADMCGKAWRPGGPWRPRGLSRDWP